MNTPHSVIALAVILSGVIALTPTASTAQGGAAGPRPIAPRSPLSPAEQATIDLFRRVSPSVVFVTSLSRYRDRWSMNVTEVPQGAGTGFVWDEAGHIVTNFHVIAEASAVEVTLDDETTLPARVVGVAPDKDLAVLRVQPRKPLRPIDVGTSADLLVGQSTYAIGNPFGLDHSLTTGVVSALGRSITGMNGREIEDCIQTDAAINPGNSGGPLLDSSARLIGVNTMIKSPSGASAGIGFAVPVDTVNKFVPQLIQFGRVVRPILGVRLTDDRVMRRAGLEGVMLATVEKGGPAARAGLRGVRESADGRVALGDIVVALNGRAVRRSDDLLSALERLRPGDTVVVTYVRDRARYEARVTLAAPR